MQKTPSLILTRRFQKEDLTIGYGEIREGMQFAAIYDSVSNTTQPDYIRKYGPKKGTWCKAQDIWIIEGKYTHSSFISELITKILFLSEKGISDFEQRKIKQLSKKIDMYANESALLDLGGFGSKYSTPVKPHMRAIDVVLEALALARSNGTILYPKDFDNFGEIEILNDPRIIKIYQTLAQLKDKNFEKNPEGIISEIAKLEKMLDEPDYFHAIESLIEICYELLTEFDYSYSDMPDGSVEVNVSCILPSTEKKLRTKKYTFAIVPKSPRPPHPATSSWNNTGFSDEEVAHAYYVAPPSNWSEGPTRLIAPYPESLDIKSAFVRSFNGVDGIVKTIWYGYSKEKVGEYNFSVFDLENTNSILEKYKIKQDGWKKRGLNPQNLAHNYVSLFKKLYSLDTSIKKTINGYAKEKYGSTINLGSSLKDFIQSGGKEITTNQRELRDNELDRIENEYITECKKIVKNISVPYDEWDEKTAKPLILNMEKYLEKYSEHVSK